MADIHDLNVDQGSDFEVQLQLLDALDEPLDLTGCSAAMDLRKSFRGASFLSLTSDEGGGLTIDAESGTITIDITHEQSSALGYGVYLYDLELIFPDETVWRVIEGRLNNRPEVTWEASNG